MGDRRARQAVLGVAGVVGAAALIAGPLAEAAGAVDEVTKDTPASRLRGRVSHTDHGSTDEWADQRVSEGYLSPGQVTVICEWQGFRTFEHEQTGEWSSNYFSNQHSGCFFTPQWAEPPDKTTSELWDLVFKWKSGNTNNEHMYIGKVNH